MMLRQVDTHAMPGCKFRPKTEDPFISMIHFLFCEPSSVPLFQCDNGRTVHIHTSRVRARKNQVQ